MVNNWLTNYLVGAEVFLKGKKKTQKGFGLRVHLLSSKEKITLLCRGGNREAKRVAPSHPASQSTAKEDEKLASTSYSRELLWLRQSHKAGLSPRELMSLCQFRCELKPVPAPVLTAASSQ